MREKKKQNKKRIFGFALPTKKKSTKDFDDLVDADDPIKKGY
jgi:hypothetical protein